MVEIRFNVSSVDHKTITKIAARAVAVSLSQGSEPVLDQCEILMDLTAVHANGCPLRLDDFLSGLDFDFSHDIAGIRRYLNRETGQLGGCFSPRFAA